MLRLAEKEDADQAYGEDDQSRDEEAELYLQGEPDLSLEPPADVGFALHAHALPSPARAFAAGDAEPGQDSNAGRDQATTGAGC